MLVVVDVRVKVWGLSGKASSVQAEVDKCLVLKRLMSCAYSVVLTLPQ